LNYKKKYNSIIIFGDINTSHSKIDKISRKSARISKMLANTIGQFTYVTFRGHTAQQ
jgi:hypothetical protein